ncbi:MAG: hypothetical protein FWD47_11070 [Treponema sp.]|nr:hypothetical protein [Treponema sp.]
MKIKSLFIFIFISTMLINIFAEDDFFWIDGAVEYDYLYEGDFVYLVIDELNIYSYEKINEGIYDNGIPYNVYQLSDSIIITISVDENGLYYIVGNVATNDAMHDILDYLTGIYTVSIPYLDKSGYTAFYHDTENLFIKDHFSDYIGTFTLYGNFLFVEEVITQEKIIVQRQWSTPDFYEILNDEIDDDWGFIAFWDIIQNTLPAQYTVRLWRETGDSFSAIAGLPFIYGDPLQWRVLYEANKNKLPNPNNPHLIYPGTILDIPNLSGEVRSGMWNSNAQ